MSLATPDTPSEIASVLDGDAATLSLPTRLEWVGRASEFLAERAVRCGVCAPERVPALVMALHEALTNAIVHGNLGISSELKEQPGDAFERALAERLADPALAERRVAVTFNYDGRECSIAIRDEGGGFDAQTWLATHHDGPAGDEVLRASGRGILMMQSLVDRVVWRHGGREVVLTLIGPQRTDRRESPRQALAEPVRVLPLTVGNRDEFPPAWQGVSRNISEGGIAIIQSQGHTARRVLLELRDAKGAAVYVPAEVCRVTPLAGGLFELGCRFSAPPGETNGITKPPRAVERLMSKMGEQAGEHERRADPRVPYSGRIEVRVVRESAQGSDSDADEFRPAFGRDLSRGGVAFVASFELPLGLVELRLTPPGEDPQTPRPRIPARVVRCQRVTAGVYDIGCQFV